MRTLNITNGDSTARLLKESTVAGDVLAWRDPMHHGPFPADLTLEELRPIRGKYLAGPNHSKRDVIRDFALRDDHLAAAPSYDRVVLWFEHDLLDQLQILQILDWCATAELAQTRLEIICIDQFPGIVPFRGLGQLDASQIATLEVQAAAVTDDMLRLAQDGWRAFRSEDPRDLMGFLEGDLQVLPFLRQALMRQLEEYPSASTGLTRSETRLLSLLVEGDRSPSELFVQNMAHETALFLGDWGTFAILDRLAHAGLVHSETLWQDVALTDAAASYRAQTLSLTQSGRVAAAGRIDLTGQIPRDDWLGGVQIRADRPHWTWDAAQKTLLLRML